MRSFFAVAVTTLLSGILCAQTGSHYVITNDDVLGPNTATFYRTSGSHSNPKLTQRTVVRTGGQGLGVGYVSGKGLALLDDGENKCAFIADAGTNDVAAIDLQSRKVTGRFKGSAQDNGGLEGMELATSNKFLYADFTGNFMIATYKIGSACTLKFISDVPATGRNLGAVTDLAIRGTIMVVSYGDGSIESFNISKGTPVSNGDRQLSTGTARGVGLPFAVDITRDGHFVLFGDNSSETVVEVSDISSGKLDSTVPYVLSSAADSSSLTLSPDESLLYISNTAQGTVTAALFDKNTGILLPGCTSSSLNGFNGSWFYVGGLTTA